MSRVHKIPLIMTKGREGIKNKFFSLSCGFLSFCCTQLPQAWGSGADEEKFLQQLQSGFIKDRVDATKTIERETYDIPAVYDFIANKLEKENGQNITTPDQADEVAWLCKALASSGDARYRDLLLRVNTIFITDKPKLMRQDHCRQAADNIPTYAVRQQVIKQGQGLEGVDPTLNKIVKLLRSGEPAMVSDGAKMLMRNSTRDERAFDIAKDVLLAGYNERNSDPRHVDAMAWVCKCLASTGLPKYKADLQNVAATAVSSKLSNYAKEAAAALP